MDSSKSKNSPVNIHLSDTLKDINTALEDWDKITNKAPSEQDVSKENVEKHTKELLLKLQEQINDLSEDI